MADARSEQLDKEGYGAPSSTGTETLPGLPLGSPADATSQTWTDFGKEITKQSALPIGGQLLGAGVGALTGPAAPVAIPMLSALGGFTGEVLNQGLGITEPSYINMGLAAMPVPGSRVAREGTMGLMAAKPALDEIALRSVGSSGERLMSKWTPPIESGKLFQRAIAAGSNIKIAMPETANTLFDAQRELSMSPLKYSSTLKSIIKGVDQVAGSGQMHVPFENVRILQSGIGHDLRKMAVNAEGKEQGIAKQIYKAMWKDVNDGLAQAQGPTASILRDAVVARKHEDAIELISEILKPTFTKDGERTLAPLKGIMAKVESNRDVLNRVLVDGDAGVNEIQSILKVYAEMTAKPGAGIASKLLEQHPIWTGAAAAATAYGTGHGSGIGMGAAGLAGIAAESMLAVALGSAPGRTMLRQMAEHGIRFDQLMGVLGQAATKGVGNQLGFMGPGSGSMSAAPPSMGLNGPGGPMPGMPLPR